MTQATPGQEAVCARNGVTPAPVTGDQRVGVSRNLREGGSPIHGVRHVPVGDMSGWYLWSGELQPDDDFFVPLHVAHLAAWCPAALELLALPPGHRFLIAEGYQDVWFDASLLDGG